VYVARAGCAKGGLPIRIGSGIVAKGNVANFKLRPCVLGIGVATLRAGRGWIAAFLRRPLYPRTKTPVDGFEQTGCWAHIAQTALMSGSECCCPKQHMVWGNPVTAAGLPVLRRPQQRYGGGARGRGN